MCLSLCQAIKVYSVCLSDHVKKTKVNRSRDCLWNAKRTSKILVESLVFLHGQFLLLS